MHTKSDVPIQIFAWRKKKKKREREISFNQEAESTSGGLLPEERHKSQR